MYIPPSVDIWGFGDSTSLIRDVRMRFNRSVVENLLEDEWDRKKWNEPVLLLYDERLRQIAELIWQECHNELEVSPLYGESLTAAFLAGMFNSSSTLSSALRSGLGRLQLKRTLEYIDANLLKELRLKELAGIVGLSASHFGRAFKTATGLSPHRWVMQRRIQLAQRLMKDSGKSISIAAHATGFLSQSHFTKVFHSITGTTPRSWLRDQGLDSIERDEAIPMKLAISDKSSRI
jgi:AraC-like DNA-binding protein